MRNIPYELFSNVQFPPEVQSRRVRMVVDNELTETQRRAIVGYFFEDKSIREISAILSIPQGTVKYHLSQGRNHLKEHIQL